MMKVLHQLNFYEYTPQTQANNNTPGHQISITINDQDNIHFHPKVIFL